MQIRVRGDRPPSFSVFLGFCFGNFWSTCTGLPSGTRLGCPVESVNIHPVDLWINWVIASANIWDLCESRWSRDEFLTPIGFVPNSRLDFGIQVDITWNLSPGSKLTRRDNSLKSSATQSTLHAWLSYKRKIG